MSLGQKIYRLLAWLALVLCVILPIRVFSGSHADYSRNFENFKVLYNYATILWFIAAPVWLIPELFHHDPES